MCTGTIRRCMEKWGNEMHTVALVLENHKDFEAYKKLMPLYFPRSRREEELASGILPHFNRKLSIPIIRLCVIHEC